MQTALCMEFLFFWTGNHLNINAHVSVVLNIVYSVIKSCNQIFEATYEFGHNTCCRQYLVMLLITTLLGAL